MCDAPIDLRFAGGGCTAVLNGHELPTADRLTDRHALQRLYGEVRTGATLWIERVGDELQVKIYRRVLGSYEAPSSIRGEVADTLVRLITSTTGDLPLPAMVHAHV